MKKIVTGVGLLIAGAILTLSVFITTTGAMTILTSWYTQLGRFWSAMVEINVAGVFVVAIILMILGVAAIILGNREHGEKE